MALLLTYPSLTLAGGSVLYLAMIPVSAYRYLAEQRKAAKSGKAQTKTPANEQPLTGAEDQVVRLRAKQ
jgi:hypothetical protein